MKHALFALALLLFLSVLGAIGKSSAPAAATSESAAPGCNVSWVLSGEGYSSRRRVVFEVQFEQIDNQNGFNVTTCEIVVVKVQKRVLGFWWSTTADSITVAGSFSGPRSPVDQWGVSSYVHSNPFSNVKYDPPFLHFTDTSPTSLPCYTMTHGIYTVTAKFGSTTVNAQVGW